MRNELQNILYDEVKGICPYCEKQMTKSWERDVYVELPEGGMKYIPITKEEWRDFMEIDHIDGNHKNNVFDNLIGCCKLCNIRKSNKKIGFTKQDLLLKK